MPADRTIIDLTTKNIRAAGDSFRRLQQEVRGWDFVLWEDDFLGDALDAKYPAATTGTDGSFDKIAGGLGGTATIDVGDAATSGDNEYGGIGLGGLEWKGDNNCFAVASISINSVATMKMEFGFSDSFADAGAINDLAAPTKTADECAVWIMDTDDTPTWQTATVKGGATPQKDENAAIIAPVADIRQYMGVFLEGDNAFFRQWNAKGAKIGPDISITAALDGSVAIGPWLFVKNLGNTQDRLITIDYVMVGQRRTT